MDKATWLYLEETRKLVTHLEDTIKAEEHDLGSGLYMSGSAEETAMAVSKAVGCIYGLNLVLDYLDLKQLQIDEEERED